MSDILKCQKLLEVTSEEKHAICAEFGITLDGYWELREKAMEYIDQSEHLPKDYDAACLSGCVCNNKANLEAAKRFIDNYYRCKTDYANCLFDHCVPSSKKFKESARFTYNVCTRKLLPSPHCYRVQVFKLNDPEGNAESMFDYTVMVTMMCELRGTYDFWGSSIIIFDMERLTLKNITKYTAQWAFVMKDIFESVHFRIQGFHFINGPTILEKMLVLFRAVLPAKLKERVFVHTDIESLQKLIPKECLPKEYGGFDRSLDELQNDWIEAMEELEPLFQRCRAAKSTKKYEFDEGQRNNMGIGVDGSFKKLSID